VFLEFRQRDAVRFRHAVGLRGGELDEDLAQRGEVVRSAASAPGYATEP